MYIWFIVESVGIEEVCCICIVSRLIYRFKLLGFLLNGVKIK